MGARREGKMTGAQDAFGGDGCVHSFDCGAVFTDLLMWKTLTGNTLNMSTYCVLIIPQ